jgi:hypothetical protein
LQSLREPLPDRYRCHSSAHPFVALEATYNKVIRCAQARTRRRV